MLAPGVVSSQWDQLEKASQEVSETRQRVIDIRARRVRGAAKTFEAASDASYWAERDLLWLKRQFGLEGEGDLEFRAQMRQRIIQSACFLIWINVQTMLLSQGVGTRTAVPARGMWINGVCAYIQPGLGSAISLQSV